MKKEYMYVLYALVFLLVLMGAFLTMRKRFKIEDVSIQSSGLTFYMVTNISTDVGGNLTLRSPEGSVISSARVEKGDSQVGFTMAQEESPEPGTYELVFKSESIERTEKVQFKGYDFSINDVELNLSKEGPTAYVVDHVSIGLNNKGDLPALGRFKFEILGVNKQTRKMSLGLGSKTYRITAEDLEADSFVVLTPAEYELEVSVIVDGETVATKTKSFSVGS